MTDLTSPPRASEAGEAAAQKRIRWRKLLAVGAVLTTAAALATVAEVHQGAHSAGAGASLSDSITGQPDVGYTEGYNITNESGALLIYQRVAGNVGAPPMSPGVAWLPGQTLNFQVGVNETGDALFEAYTVGGSNGGAYAGNVDVHFNSLPNRVLEEALAYLNPLDSAPLQASATGFAPVQTDGATWTMVAGLDNKITGTSPATNNINSQYAFNAWGMPELGVTGSQLFSSITTASDSTCTDSSISQTSCTLGGNTWNFSGSF